MYAANLQNRRLTFTVYGVWRTNLLMQDRETGTIWQHATGEALAGPLHGSRLEVLPAWETTWGELRALYPGARFACEPQKFTGVLPKRLLLHALQITHSASLNGLSVSDSRLDPHEIVLGVVVNGEARAYVLTDLRARGEIRDSVGGEQIHINYHPIGDRVTIHTAAGKNLSYQRQWWLGWREFHPRCGIYRVQ